MSKEASAPVPTPEQAKLLADLGGASRVAEVLRARTQRPLSPQAVSNWIKRGIPFRYRAPLAIEARERQLEVPPNFLGEEPLPAPPDPPVPEVPAGATDIPWLP
jgi:hypothetical protein